MQNFIEPLVSVIIPTYNRGSIITTSINSVLNQTYKNLEVIIIDDFSNDNTQDIILGLDDPKIKYIKLNKKFGAAAARNKGIKEAKGEYISFLDSDDTIHQTKIEKQLTLILNNPEYSAVYCGINLIDHDSKKIIGQKIHNVDFYNNFKNGKFLLTPTTGTLLVKKEAINEIGGFDETLPAHQDTELAIRFSQKFKYLLLNEYLVNAIKNHDQISSAPKNHIIGKEIIFNKHNKFLSKDILFSLSRQILSFYIKHGNIQKAKLYLKEAIKIKPAKIDTYIYLIVIYLFPPKLYNIVTKR